MDGTPMTQETSIWISPYGSCGLNLGPWQPVVDIAWHRVTYGNFARTKQCSIIHPDFVANEPSKYHQVSVSLFLLFFGAQNLHKNHDIY